MGAMDETGEANEPYLVSGSGSTSTSGPTETINQSSSVLGLNWNAFDLGSSASVIYQPSSDSSWIAINTILDTTPSQIYGMLSGTGQVFLTNPNGIVSGATANINVGGLLAPSLTITNSFSPGQYSLDLGNSPSAVSNAGTLQASPINGSVTLVGGSVSNNGTVFAPSGHINLVATDHAVLVFDSNGLMNITLPVNSALAGAAMPGRPLLSIQACCRLTAAPCFFRPPPLRGYSPTPPWSPTAG
jgi:filamentous hemagglutinin family protein